VIINISEIRIYLWRVVGQKDYRDCGQKPGVGYGPDTPSHGVLNSGKLAYSISTLNSDKISKIWDEMKIKFGYNENKI
jgi:hypothetical protein